MELSENDPRPPPNPGPLAKTVLLSIFKDGTETPVRPEFSHPVQLERFHQYNNDFKDYTDCDTSTNINYYDKFQVRVSTVIQLEVVEFQAPHVENEKKDLAVQLESLLEKKAPDILTEHQQTRTLSTSSRKKLVKLSLSDLVEKHGL
ncbi:hypothetical protein N1851_005093 [Merluccius polli]|uniref:Uncharacterized protein n=1 Tax=Merluccius polli TaxID=89951 RepID=A0AA47N7X8_MERPO|nr:hypothetical protein N1851_005093 [Merluccius polli]